MEKISGHLSEEQLEAFMSGKVSAEEKGQMYTHIKTCDYCAELLAACLEEDLLSPPAYLQEEILEKSRSIEIQTVRTIRQTSRQTRLFFYSLKVGFALAVSLLLLFVFPQTESASVRQEMYFLEEKQNFVTEKIRAGSDKIDSFVDHVSGWQIFMDEEE